MHPGGIGREILLALAQHGATALVCGDINLEAAQQAIAAVGQQMKTHALRVDVADEASVQSMVDDVQSRYGRIDYFVNSSGVSRRKFAPLLVLADG